MLELFWFTFSFILGIFLIIKIKNESSSHEQAGFLIIFFVQFLILNVYLLFPIWKEIYQNISLFLPKIDTTINWFSTLFVCFCIIVIHVLIQNLIAEKFKHFNFDLIQYRYNQFKKNIKKQMKEKQERKIKTNSVKGF